MKLVTSTPNGQIFVCARKRKLHLEFGNLFLMLTYDEFNQLAAYIKSIDYQHYLEKNKNAQNKRKLLLNIGFQDMFFAVTATEFLELKNLISLQKKKHCMLHSSQINNNVLQLN
ncbi:MAG: DUF6686 family protein [Bacteroidota bacterium]